MDQNNLLKLCAQEMALTASSTLDAELNCLQINTKYIATVTSSEGRDDNSELCDEHHLQN